MRKITPKLHYVVIRLIVSVRSDKYLNDQLFGVDNLTVKKWSELDRLIPKLEERVRRRDGISLTQSISKGLMRVN
jgi:hypothetical protein